MLAEQFTWDPATYAEFNDLRSRPFFDLTTRIAADAPRTVTDLGCGPGNLTAALARRWPGARVTGLDSSPEMVAAARAAFPDAGGGTEPGRYDGGARPGGRLDFALGDLRQWRPDPGTDVVVSNAALQWVPGHQELMAGWLEAFAPGAWLAVQVPGNFDAPSHVLMRQLAAAPRWRKQLDGVLRHSDALAEPARYHELLLAGGATADVWETTYSQLLQGPRPVLEWVRGTGLRPVLAALAPEEAASFEDEYAALLEEAYPPGPHGTLFAFRRIFAVGCRL